MTTPPLPVLPVMVVEAGLIGDTPGSTGTALKLNDAVLGLLDTGTLTAGTTWLMTSITQWVLGFTITRPSTLQAGPLWTYQAGTCSVLLDNSDGRFDPDNLAGPYVTGGVSQITPMVQVRVRAAFGPSTFYLFNGFADGWAPGQVTYEGGYAELTLTATDAFKALAAINLPTVSIEGAGADTGTRISDILSRSGWYSTGERNLIDAGDVTLAGTTLGDYALNLMQVAADSEIGQLYVSGNGAVVFRRRKAQQLDARSSTVQAVFGDLPGTVQPAGTELAYAAVTAAMDDTTLINDVQATRTGTGTPVMQEVKNAASIAQNLFARTYQRTDLILQTDAAVLLWAQDVIGIAARRVSRIDSLTVDPQADPANLWPQVLGREIGDRIQVVRRPAGVASPVIKNCFITGITHTWDSLNSAWSTTWTLRDAYGYAPLLLLDDATFGALDTYGLAWA